MSANSIVPVAAGVAFIYGFLKPWIDRVIFRWVEGRCSCCHHRRGAHKYTSGPCMLKSCYCEGFKRG